jgi:hypothetical protein
MYCPRCDNFFAEYSPVTHLHDLPEKSITPHNTHDQYVYCPVSEVWIDTTGDRKNILHKELYQNALYWGYVNGSVEQFVPQL